MFLEVLSQSHQRGGLICPKLCRFRKCRDGSVTIYEIWVTPCLRGDGHGRMMVEIATAGAPLVRAWCPSDLPSNDFWRHLGFEHVASKKLKTGRTINLWEKTCV